MDARRHAMMLAVVGVSGGGSTDTQLTVGTDSENVQEGRKEGRERKKQDRRTHRRKKKKKVKHCNEGKRVRRWEEEEEEG